MTDTNSFLQSLVKVVDNNSMHIVSDGIKTSDINSYIDTGCYILNAMVSGSIFKGIPSNKIVALAGESSTGKTYFALSMVKKFLMDNPKSNVVYFDTESAITSEMFEDREIPTDRIMVINVATVEDFKTQCLQILNHYESQVAPRNPLMLVLDSLGQLSSAKEMADSVEGKNVVDMTRSKTIRALFRVLTIKLGLLGVPLLVTNHTYTSIGFYPTQELGGGEGLKYSASIVIFLSKKKEKAVVDGETKTIGNVIHCKLKKGRFTKEESLVDVKLFYDTGLDKYYGLVDLAVKHGIFKQISTRIELPDGSKIFAKTINDDPEKYFTKEILEKIDKAAAKEFLYGDSFKSKQSKPEEIANGSN